MPFDILNILLKEFKKTYAQLTEQMSKEPGSVDQGEFEAFGNLVASLNAADSYKNTVSAGDGPLAKSDAAMAASFIDDFVDKFEKYSKESPIYKPKLACDLCKGVEYTLIAVKAQSEYLKEASKLEDGALMPKMKDIMSDYRWVEAVFTEDPDIAENKKEPAVKWISKEHSVEENINKYKDTVQDLDKKFLDHVRRIAGNVVDPMGAFSSKVDLVLEVLNTIGGDSEALKKIRGIKPMYKIILNKFDLYNLDSLDSKSIITKSLIEREYENSFDTGVIAGDIEKLQISDKDKKHFKKLVSKLQVKPENLGIDAETMQVLENSASIFDLVNKSVNNLLDNNGGYDSFKDGNNNDPIYDVLKQADYISKKAAAYIKGEPNAKPVVEKDILDFMDALGSSAIKTNPLRYDGSVNLNYSAGISLIRAFSEVMPACKDKYNEFVLRDQKRRKNKTENFYKELAEADFDEQEYDDILRDFRTLKRAKYLDEEVASKIEFLDLCRNSYTRRDVLKSGTPEQKVLASIIDNEMNNLYYLDQNGDDLRNNLKHSYNPVLKNVITGGYVLTSDDLQKLESFHCALLESAAVKQMIESAKTASDELFADGNCGKLLFENGENVIASLPAETIDALSQTSGNLYSSNSEEYTNLGSAMKEYASEAHRPEGVSGETCRKLYEACTAYMYTHDSKPSSSNGKLRFNAAASVMAKIVPEMLKKNPEMRADVEKDIKINMIRSKHFRSEMIRSGSGYEAMALNIGNVLQAGKKADMITGKVPTEELRTGLLNAYKKLERKVEGIANEPHAAEHENHKSKDKNMII